MAGQLQYFTQPSDIAGLRNYKYSAIDKSFIAHRILNPYWWTPLVEFFPRWVAPNLITLFGFVCVVVNILLLIYYSPNLETQCPDWVYLSFFFGLFWYQTMDNIDGKQARRTGTSGPLGELFDHGCDALNTGIANLMGLNAMGVPQSMWYAIIVLTTLTNFYLNTWEEYHTGTLYLSEISGPVEGLLSICAVFLIRYFAGPNFFISPLADTLPTQLVDFLGRENIPDTPTYTVTFILGIIMVVFNGIFSYLNVIKSLTSRGECASRAFMGFVPLGLTKLGLILWLYMSPTISTSHLLPFTLIATLLFGYHVGKIIVAHVAKRPFPYLSPPTPFVLLLALVGSGWIAQHVDDTMSLGDVVATAVDNLSLMVSSSLTPLFGDEAVAADWDWVASLLLLVPTLFIDTWKALVWENTYLAALIAPTTYYSTLLSSSSSSSLSPSPLSVSFSFPPLINATLQRDVAEMNAAAMRASTMTLASSPAVLALEGILAWSLVVVAMALYAATTSCVVSELCAIFDIHCLVIKKKKSAINNGVVDDEPIAVVKRGRHATVAAANVRRGRKTRGEDIAAAAVDLGRAFSVSPSPRRKRHVPVLSESTPVADVDGGGGGRKRSPSSKRRKEKEVDVNTSKSTPRTKNKSPSKSTVKVA